MAAGEKPLKVWDAPVRLFHWALVLLFAFMFFTGKSGSEWIEWHMRAGYAILALLIFRILWGLFGSTHARFASFLKGPAAGIAFARKLMSKGAATSLGHNPIGGWMVVALIAVMLVQAGTGLFANDDLLSEGPLASSIAKELSDRLTSFHSWNFNLLLLLAGVHVAAVLYHWLVKKENLISAMFTGVKKVPADHAEAAPARFASAWLALALAVLAALIVFLIVKRPF